VREQLLRLLRAVLGGKLRELLTFENRLRIETKPPYFLLEQATTELDAANPLLSLQHMLDLAARPRRGHKRQPVAARLVPCLPDDFDDVAVLEARAERNHLAVDARADTLVADVGVYRVREVHRRGTARQRFHLALRRKDVDLLRVEIDLQVLQELLRVTDFLLRLEQLPHPLEIALIALVADAPFLVLPVRRDAFFRMPVHFLGANLHLEGKAMLADDRRMQRLIPVRPRHRDEVLDASRDRRPGLVNDAERRVAVLHRLRDDAQRDEVIDALEIDLLPLELQMNAVEALHAPVNANDRNLRFVQLGLDFLREVVNDFLGELPLAFNPGTKRLIRLRLEIPEGELLELVFHLAHPEPIRDGRVDVERFLRNLHPPVFGQVVQRPHVVQPVGELHEDDPDVIHHRQQHLAEVFGLALLARRERDGAQFCNAFHDMCDFGAEQLSDALRRGDGVFDDVMEQAGGHRHDV
jgi:hypothetical protein